MPISGCHDLPLATFNLPSRNNLQNKPNSADRHNVPPVQSLRDSAAATPAGRILSHPREWMARGGLVFVFFLGGCSGVGRVLTTGAAARGIRGLGRFLRKNGVLRYN